MSGEDFINLLYRPNSSIIQNDSGEIKLQFDHKKDDYFSGLEHTHVARPNTLRIARVSLADVLLMVTLSTRETIGGSAT